VVVKFVIVSGISALFVERKMIGKKNRRRKGMKREKKVVLLYEISFF